VNFRQVEEDSKGAINLLMLLSFLEASDIPESMLRRGCSTKRIWNRDGEVAELSPIETGLDPDVVGLISDEMKLDRAVEHLLEFSLIQLNSSQRGGRRFSIHLLVQYCASHRVDLKIRQKWQTQAILLVCQAFPFNAYIAEESVYCR
jgi:hypothetical protein